MKVGTKSVLFGVHSFLIHPFIVAIAWISLYGWPFDIRIIFSFFLHDLGYFGKPNMDGVEGETHPELGAKIMHFLFDGFKYHPQRAIEYDRDDISRQQFQRDMKRMKRDVVDVIFGNETIKVIYAGRFAAKTKWYNFTLLHSRYYAKKKNQMYSRLCVADKYAFVIEPKWFYKFRGMLSGECKEYMAEHHYTDFDEWHRNATDYTRKWVMTHKDLIPDKWTTERTNELSDELCNYCPWKEIENKPRIALCEGSYCGQAYERYHEVDKFIIPFKEKQKMQYFPMDYYPERETDRSGNYEDFSKTVMVYEKNENGYIWGDIGYYSFDMRGWHIFGESSMKLICWSYIPIPREFLSKNNNLIEVKHFGYRD